MKNNGQMREQLKQRLLATSDLNPEQQQALKDDKHIIVTAGAGTGKTRILETYYLYLLFSRPELKVDNVVAITYTNKAAAEMRQRIRQRLLELISKTADARENLFLLKLKDTITTGYISTIHSFCTRLLREFAMEAGLDPGFLIIEDIEQSLTVEGLIDKTLADISRVTPEDKLYQTLQECLKYQPSSHLRKTLRQIIYNRHLIAEWLHRYRAATYKELEDFWQTLNAEKGKAVSHQYTYQYLRALSQLSLHLLGQYQASKLSGAFLDFDDLLIRTYQLLCRDTRIRNGLAQQFHYILVDEFQDTDPLQWEILKCLRASDNKRPKIFIVGDPKQSIYGFRHADVRVFKAATEELAQSNIAAELGSGQIGLDLNYRALPNLINFTNFLFNQLFQPAASEYEVAPQTLRGYRSDSTQQTSDKVEFLLLDKEKVGEFGLSDNAYSAEAEFIARRIKALVATEKIGISENQGSHPIKFGDIAILLRRATYLREYEQALKRYAIPFVTIGGLGFFQRQEIWDLYHLLSFLLDQNNDLALVALLRSCLFSFTDELLYKVARKKERSFWRKLLRLKNEPELVIPEEEKQISFAIDLLNDLIWHSHIIGVSVLLQRAMQLTGGWAVYAVGREGQYQLANIEKFLDLAAQFEASGYSSLASFLEKLDLLIESGFSESEAQPQLLKVDAVKLLTVHKAKGLDFPVVIFPELGAFFKYSPDLTMFIDPEVGIGVKLYNPDKNFSMADTVLSAAQKKREKEQINAEEKRIFYVATTRARDCLILSGIFNRKRSARLSRLNWLLECLNVDETMLAEDSFEFTLENPPVNIMVYTDPNIFKPEMAALEPVGAAGQSPSAKISSQQLKTVLPLTPKSAVQTYSVTQLMAFEHNPEEYYRRYILGIRQDLLEPDRPDLAARRYAMSRGSLVHQFLEAIGTPAADNKDALIPMLVNSAVELNLQEKERLKQEVTAIVDKFYTTSFSRQLISASQSVSEFPFRLKVDEETFVVGKVDCLFQDAERRWQIVDYKTGYLRPEEVERAVSYYQLQVNLYGLFLARFSPEQGTWPVILYFPEADCPKDKILLPPYISPIEAHLKDLIKKVKEFEHLSQKP